MLRRSLQLTAAARRSAAAQSSRALWSLHGGGRGQQQQLRRILRPARFVAGAGRPWTRSFCSVPVGGGDSESSAGGASVTGAPGVESPGDKFVMIYTCNVCETRAAKTISKHAYNSGVVLVRCPGCENLHLVADRLGWFEDESTDVESLLKQRGESVRYVTNDNVLELTADDIGGKPVGKN